jgi:hypothetical protein
MRGYFLNLFFVLYVVGGAYAQTDPQAVQFGSWVSKNLRAGGEDWFSVKPAVNGLLSAETRGDTDVYMELYDERRSLLAENDDGAESEGNSRIEYMAEAGKTYLIKIRGYDADITGPYRLLAAIEPVPPDALVNTSRNRAAAIEPGVPADGFFRSHSESRWYRFTVPSGKEQALIYTGGTLDTILVLYDGQGNRIAEDDDSGSDGNARISALLPQGIALIEVKEYDGNQGRYTLSVQVREPARPDRFEGDSTAAEAKDISVGESQQRTFTDSDDVDWARLRITRQGTYEIRSTAADGYLDSYLELFDADKELITGDDDSGGDFDAYIELQLNPGTYYIQVTTLDDDPLEDNRYTLSVSAGSP